MRTNALPSSARKNSCVLHDVRPGAFDVRKRASLRQLCLGLKFYDFFTFVHSSQTLRNGSLLNRGPYF